MMNEEPTWRMIMLVLLPLSLVVMVGIGFAIRTLMNGSGRQVAWMFGGIAFVVLLLALFFVRAQSTAVVNVPVVTQGNSVSFDHLPTSVTDDRSFTTIFYSAKLLLILIAAAVLVGILYLIYHMARSPGGRTTLVVGGIGLVLLAMFFVGFQTLNYSGEKVVYKQYGSNLSVRRGEQNVPENQFQGITIPHMSREEVLKPKVSDSAVKEPETKTFTPDAGDGKPTAKPAWLTQGKQMVNGNPQFPVSSELFDTVTECQRDLDRRMPQLIAEEIPYLAGESFSVPLLPSEVQLLTADSYTEEIPLANGTWYKVHRFVKVDQPVWTGIYNRFQQAKLESRLQTIGISFGGVLLVLGMVYLFLRRPPRVVDPTLNTFSTT